jgi:hypothetical protein
LSAEIFADEATSLPAVSAAAAAKTEDAQKSVLSG